MLFMKRICIYLVPLFVGLFFSWFCHAGIVTAVTRADIKGKAVVLFHDRHQGYIDIQGVRYDKLEESQQKPLFTYFGELFKKIDGKLPFLLECRPVLKKRLQELPKGTTVTSIVGFFEQFYSAYAKPQERPQLNTLCDIDSFDGRDTDDECIGDMHMQFNPIINRLMPGSFELGLLNYQDQFEKLDAKKQATPMASIVHDAQYQKEKKDILTEYGYTKAEEWFAGIESRVEKQLEELQPIIGQLPYFEQKKEFLNAKLAQVKNILQAYCKQSKDILAGMYAYIEQDSGSFVKLGTDLARIFELICSITDLQLLHDIFTTSDNLIFVHVGGMHARQLELDLANLGARATRVTLLKTADDVADPMRLYEKLQEIAPVDELAQKMCRAQQSQAISPKTDCSGELSKKDMPVQEGFIATIVVILKKLFGLVFAQ